MSITKNRTAPVSGYSGLQIALHWTVAALIVYQIAAHESMAAVWEALEDGEQAGPTDAFLAQIHVWGGIAILVFAVWRLWLRYTRGAPALPQSEHWAARLVAHATHVLLYAVMLGAPLLGAAAWFGGIEQAAEIHEMVKFPLIALVVLHAGGALVQHFVLKTDVLKRMTRPQA
jgi:cytochrome b561